MSIDVARIIIIVLLGATVWSMATVTWRLSPSMQWYEQVARVGITLVFISQGGNTIRAINKAAPYTFWTWLLTTGLLFTTFAFARWAHHLPRRSIRIRKGQS